MKRIGIEPGESFDFDKPDPAVQEGARGCASEAAQKLMEWKLPSSRALRTTGR